MTLASTPRQDGDLRRCRHHCPGPRGAFKRPRRSPLAQSFFAGCLTAKNGGFRPGQCFVAGFVANGYVMISSSRVVTTEQTQGQVPAMQDVVGLSSALKQKLPTAKGASATGIPSG